MTSRHNSRSKYSISIDIRISIDLQYLDWHTHHVCRSRYRMPIEMIDTHDLPWQHIITRNIQTFKKLFWSVKKSGEILNKLKSRGFRATSLSNVFSTLYTTLPDNLIKEKLIDLIEWTFKREDSPYLAWLSSLLETQNDINFGRIKTCVKA